MRVITGIARGRRLITLEGDDVRPTTDKVKEALFSIIQFELEGRHVLDLFAGSGQLGIEALSRGAKSAVFVDKSKKSIEIVKSNLKTTGLEKSAVVVNSDSIAFLKTRREKFDIAFLDPPYSKGILQQALEFVPNVMSESGVIICESPKEEVLPESIGEFMLTKRYSYGKMSLTTYRRTCDD
ncbi:MAG: 16S rRNA (guanine(966)-N(2))-methyltransferase RsmD [Faecalibacterium sp.]|nr:16S rRNA (guanine(966)-N(2))-methyltransferase RsmD [Ruminococcus sp.]MCM1391174.1 16S rRNA (guanine(966)-N(2))-methyltransferase RsmD [Ruminococcus sp.]MCM1486112.1 16S rRNA (guanine(966)-N(2))-methyltransferase RsmD [Faecalibacterium sp.]